MFLSGLAASDDQSIMSALGGHVLFANPGVNNSRFSLPATSPNTTTPPDTRRFQWLGSVTAMPSEM